MNRSFRPAGVVAALAVLAMIAISASLADAEQSQGGQATDLTGKFVSFQNGVLSINVPKGRLAGSYSFNVPDGVMVVVYTSPGHPQTMRSPAAFANAGADTSVEVTLDSRSQLVRIAVGDQKAGKKK